MKLNKQLIIIITSIIIYIILNIIYRIYYTTSKNNFNNIDTKYNLINYIDEVQRNYSPVLTNNIPINTAVSILPKNINTINDFGFESCNDAINYFKTNNIDLYEQSREIPKPLAEICSSYLGSAEYDFKDYQNYNHIISNIINDINNNLDSKLLSSNHILLKNYIENRYPQMLTDKNFTIDKTINNILQFYKNNTNKNTGDNLEKYSRFIYGNFNIIPNQFIQLNSWNIQILSDTINFIYLKTIVLSYNYNIIHINTKKHSNDDINFLYIKLGQYKIINIQIIQEYEIDNLIKLLNDLDFKPNKYIYISAIQLNVYAFKTIDFNTMFLIKKNLDYKQHISLNAIIN